MAEDIPAEKHKRLLEDAVKDALVNQRIELLEKGIQIIQSDIKEHSAQSKIGYDSLKDFISGVSHETEQRSMQCQEELKREFYTHLSEKYATKDYVDNSVRYMKLAAIFGAVTFLSTIIGFVVIISKLGGV